MRQFVLHVSLFLAVMSVGLFAAGVEMNDFARFARVPDSSPLLNLVVGVGTENQACCMDANRPGCACYYPCITAAAYAGTPGATPPNGACATAPSPNGINLGCSDASCQSLGMSLFNCVTVNASRRGNICTMIPGAGIACPNLATCPACATCTWQCNYQQVAWNDPSNTTWLNVVICDSTSFMNAFCATGQPTSACN